MGVPTVSVLLEEYKYLNTMRHRRIQSFVWSHLNSNILFHPFIPSYSWVSSLFVSLTHTYNINSFHVESSSRWLHACPCLIVHFICFLHVNLTLFFKKAQWLNTENSLHEELFIFFHSQDCVLCNFTDSLPVVWMLKVFVVTLGKPEVSLIFRIAGILGSLAVIVNKMDAKV